MGDAEQGAVDVQSERIAADDDGALGEHFIDVGTQGVKSALFFHRGVLEGWLANFTKADTFRPFVSS